MNKKLVLTACIMLLSAITSQAYKMINIPDRAKTASVRVSVGDCVAGSSQTDLYINNVRARMLDDGDKWWNLAVAYYQVPQVSAGQIPVCSIFAGAIWVGGVDAEGQLKIAAATYRQNGNDWYPGPIPGTHGGGAVTQATCSAFDNHWQVFGGEIDTFINITTPKYSTGTYPNILINIPISAIPQDILMWPGTGSPYNPVTSYADGATLAPYANIAGEDFYDPTKGDYPIIQPSAVGGPQCNNPKGEYGDQMIWWCYNDLGNIHTETGGLPIGMQVNEEAWAYQTSDYLNSATFYHYRIINTAPTVLDSVFMAQWVDPDLGWYDDDYAGCDTTRSLGIDYNGEAVDGPGTPNYGDQPPLVGTTYFQGPSYQLPKTKTDTTTKDVQLGMTSFVWYINNFSAIGNPVGASQYYGYLSGTWPDGTPFTQGGDGHGGSTPSKFMFPSDPPAPLPAWSDCSEHNPSGDVRYIQASGPFQLAAGAVNDIVVGAVWVQPPVGTYPCPSFLNTIDPASDEAQALFNGCFAIVNGPDAPDVTITELNQELVLNLENTNNASVEQYNQVSSTIKSVAPNSPDSTYKFEGYQIYQLLNNQVTSAEYNNIAEAKLIAECDVKDGVGKIINYIFDADLNANVPTLMVNGADKGIQHTFDITTDAFATGFPELVNFQPYYFSVVSYAYNNYKTVSSDTLYEKVDTGFAQVITTTVDSNPTPYLAGRLNIAVYTGIPHMSAPEADGTTINSVYGEEPFITREEGQGNGGNTIDLTQASINAILNSTDGAINHPVYQQGEGPIWVKVIDPKRVPMDSFSLALIDTGKVLKNNTNAGAYLYWLNSDPINLDSSTSKWVLTDITTGTTIKPDTSDTTIAYGNEQLFDQWGISIYINQVLGPGYNTKDNGGFLSSQVVYADPKTQWLSGLPTQAPPSSFHWEWSGTYSYSKKNSTSGPTYLDYPGADDNMVYANVISGTWAPYVLTYPKLTYTPAWADPYPTDFSQSSNYWGTSGNYPSKLAELNSIDVVFTPDQSQWSRCVVVEEDQYPSLAQGGAAKNSLRQHPSWDGAIDGNGNPVYDNSTYGLSYFPGYAINVETGQRLNIFFGEDSYLIGQNGGDMLWNPTANEFSPVGDTLLGGQHYIYVASTQYDGCNAIYNSLLTNTVVSIRAAYFNIEWTAMTFLAPGSSMLPLSQGLIPGAATVQIRIAKPYALYSNGSLNASGDSLPVYNFGLKGLAADTDNNAEAKNALDYIEVVPNPYYGYDNYEQSSLDNEIKFTNLPQVCTISIYTLDGELVTTINYTGPYDAGKINNTESTNWNLTNTNGTPIASGVYLMYFSSPGLGTHCIKWFGVRRPIDVSNF